MTNSINQGGLRHRPSTRSCLRPKPKTTNRGNTKSTAHSRLPNQQLGHEPQATNNHGHKVQYLDFHECTRMSKRATKATHAPDGNSKQSCVELTAAMFPRYPAVTPRERRCNVHVRLVGSTVVLRRCAYSVPHTRYCIRTSGSPARYEYLRIIELTSASVKAYSFILVM